MRTVDEAIASRSPESQARIKEMAYEIGRASFRERV